MYYQYKTLDEVQNRMKYGDVISGFIFDGDSEKIMVGYGMKRCSGLMNCIGISRLNYGKSTKCIGLPYVKCKIDDQIEDLLSVEVNTVGDIIGNYCLLLPLIQDGEFNGQYTVIYDDWDVGDEYFRKCLPCLCLLLFNTNVMVG